MLNGFMIETVLTLGSANAESSWAAELTAAVAGVGAGAAGAGTDAAVVPKQLQASSSSSSSPGSIQVSLLLLRAMLQGATGSAVYPRYIRSTAVPMCVCWSRGAAGA